MKKIKLISLILALVMVLGLFAACGSEKPADATTEAKTANDGNTTTEDNSKYTYGTVHGITWTNGGQADKADSAAVQREEERNAMYLVDTGNTRECVAFKYNYDTVGALFEGGGLPTLMSIALTEPQRLIANGWGRPINDCIEAVGLNLDDYDQSVLQICMDDEGNIYGLPYNAYAMCLYAHGGLYREAGLVDEDGEPIAPTTWDELIEHAKTIKEKTGKGGFAFQCSDNQGGWIFSNIAWNFGADLCVLNEETGKYEANIDTPECIAALEWYQKAVNSGAITGTPSTDNLNANMNMFKSGEASHFIVHPQVINSLTGEAHDGMDTHDIYLFNMPAGPDGQAYNLMGGELYWFAPDATDEQVIAALEYLIHYGFWQQEWTEASKTSFETSLQDLANKGEFNLFGFPVYANALFDEQLEIRNEIFKDLYDYDKQFATVYQYTNFKPEEECDVQNMYATLSSILQEISVNPDADCAALAAKANADYQTLLDIAQPD